MVALKWSLALVMTLMAQVVLSVHLQSNAESVALNRVRRQVSGSINEYLRAVLENFKSEMATGIPALKIPQMEPFKVKDQNIRKNDKKLKLRLDMTQMEVRGLSKFELPELNLDVNNLKFSLGLAVPKIEAKGQYDLDGKALNIFPVYGEGAFKVSVTGLKISTSVAVSINSNGIATLAEPPNLNVSFKSVSVNFENLLGGLSNIINNLATVLAKPIFEKMKPKLIGSLKKALFKKLNKKLSTVDITKFIG